MTIWGKLAGAAAGLAVGGPIGALVGMLAGHLAIDKDRTRKGEGKASEIAFTIGVIALGAKMAKADGVVTRDEIDAFKQTFRVPPGEAHNVARVFNMAKEDVAGYDAYARQLANLFKNHRDTLEDVLDGLFHIAKADDIVHPKEMDYLRSVAEIFGFDDAEFARIQARHVTASLSDPYVVLGMDRSASDAEIKRHYRKLVAENHPDKVIARGVPEEFVEIATQKLAAINAAYDRIEKERGL